MASRYAWVAPERLPTGTVTFLLSDVADSTRMWEDEPADMRQSLARHDALIESIVAQHAGVLVRPRGEGDSRFAVFSRASAALAAATDIQLALHSEVWPTSMALRVRIALHSGEADLRDGDYYGSTINRCARLRGLAYGGQTLVTSTALELAGGDLPPGATTHDLGMIHLAGVGAPVHVFEFRFPGATESFPPLKSADALQTNLPLQTSQFVGRAHELAQIRKQLTSHRLVTLSGAGGVGKTRLAVEIGGVLVSSYPDGVWFVELASVRDGALLPHIVAGVLHVRENIGVDLLESVIAFVRGRRMLLILDNCEHVLAAACDFAASVLRSAAGVTILASSRQPLGLSGEVTIRVPSLSLPEVNDATRLDAVRQSEAVRLFVERARLADSDFGLTSNNVAQVVKICRQLDGIPLALELAAARVRVLGAEVLAERLDERFQFVHSTDRVAPPRHQTLHATADWSYELLGDAERVLFRRLAVFVGGWTLHAAERVCPGRELAGPDVVEALSSLVDKSLVDAQTGARVTPQPRYRFLETIRAYALERLAASGEQRHWVQRHVDYMIEFTEGVERELRSAAQAAALDRLEREHDNLRAALQCAVEARDTARALRLGAAAARFWILRGYLSEGDRWLTAAVELRGQATSEIRARALNGLGNLARARAHFERAASLQQSALELSRSIGDQDGAARALSDLGVVAYLRGDREAARAFYEQSLAIRRVLGDTEGVAVLFNNLAGVAWNNGDVAAADRMWAESLTIAREMGEPWLLSLVLGNLGRFAMQRGDLEAAHRLLAESIELRRIIGDELGLVWQVIHLARVARDRGDLNAAARLCNEGMQTLLQLGTYSSAPECLEIAASIAVARGSAHLAARQLGAANRLRERLDWPLAPGDIPEYEKTVAAARAALGETDFAASWAAGRELSLDQVHAEMFSGKEEHRGREGTPRQQAENARHAAGQE